MENFDSHKKENLIITNLETSRPDEVIDNKELEEDLKDSYTYLQENTELEDPIFEKVGIKTRPTVRQNQTATDLAVEATKKLFEKSPINPKEKTLVVTGTLSAEDRYPSSASKTLERLKLTQENGFNKLTAFDISAACSGWTYGIEIASAMMVAKGFMSAIVISTDTMTRLVNKYDKSRIVFGDGATALWIKKEEPGMKGFRIINTSTITYPQNPKHVRYPTELSLDAAEDEMLRMNLRGGEVYRAGVGYSSDFITQYLSENNVNIKDIDYIIPHQANGSMLKSLAEKMELGKNKYGEDKILSNIENTGNTAASSIPLCLFDFKEKGQFKNGDRILMCSFGAGYTLGIVDVQVVQ